MATKHHTRARKARGDRKPTKREQERAKAWLAKRGYIGPEPGDPELGEFLSDIISRLREAEDAAITVTGALRNEGTTDSLCAANVLQRDCANGITEQIAQLEIALDCTSMSGSKLVINSNLKARRAQGLPPPGAQGEASS